MSIKIPIANINQPLSRNIVKQMASGGFLPVIALEAFVEGGRTYQAYQRGGFDEARERITEEFSGAVFWLGGVKGLNWVFEKIGQWINKLPKNVVDIASDNVRRPLNNYLAQETKTNGDKILRSTMAKFKLAKVLSSVLLANAFIGFALPKINQAITRSYHKNKDVNNVPANVAIQPLHPTFDDFIKKDKNDNKSKEISFNGIDYLAIANKFESSRNWQLLSVDVGTAGGRTYSARNNDERVEIGFRDISSIYFYMFNMSNMNKWLNKIETKGASSTRLDPQSAEFATRYMENYLETIKNKKVNVEQFAKDLLGSDTALPESLAARFKGKGSKITSLKAFNEELEKLGFTPAQVKKYKKLAQKMSELQPKLKGVSIITEAQARDVFNGGHINNPEFLREFFKNRFGNKFTEKYQYVAQSELDAVKKELLDYVKSIIVKARKTDAQEVTMQLLRKASNNNLKLNALNWGAGFATSALFLSTLIPKMQYMITKMRTGSDAFPGTAQYREEEKKAAA